MAGLGLSEFSDRVLLEPSGWFLLLVDEPHLDAIVGDLATELELFLNDGGVGTLSVIVPRSGSELVRCLVLLGRDDVALVRLDESVVESVGLSLDYERGRLVGVGRCVIALSAESARRLAKEAPHFWSWVGSRVWPLEANAGVLEPEARLRSLREGSGLTDEYVLGAAKAGKLGADPVFAEWLVLLGRGDLLGR